MLFQCRKGCLYISVSVLRICNICSVPYMKNSLKRPALPDLKFQLHPAPLHRSPASPGWPGQLKVKMDPLLPIIDLVIMCNNYSIITLIIVYNELVTISNNYVIGLRFAAALLPLLFGTNPRSHHKGATDRVRMETNCFQFYTIANLDKTSLLTLV